jgi:uncharacterized protein (TIGR00661 family)
LNKRRILIAPLDWGLGHASRCVPLIHALLANGAEVILAADRKPLELLRSEFPALEWQRFPGYGLRFPSGGHLMLSLTLQIPKLIRGIAREHRLLQEIILEKKIDAVISDNRYGLWSGLVPCIFITHQLFIRAPFGSRLLNLLNKSIISRYSECWVPDQEGTPNYSGELSHKNSKPANTWYIGTLSRFSTSPEIAQGLNYDLLFIVSGPEPQRSIFENKIRLQLKELRSPLKYLIVQGLPDTPGLPDTQGLPVTSVPHLSSSEMQKAIMAADLIVSRPGYSTIMDLSRFDKKAVFVPTPGQSEQIYLGEKLKSEKTAWSISQDRFSLPQALLKSKEYSGFHAAPGNPSLLNKRILMLLGDSKPPSSV